MDILKICRTLVGHLKHSVVATEKLKNVQHQMGVPQLKVKQDVSTRWSSPFIMIARLLEIREPLSVVIARMGNSKLVPHSNERSK